MRQFKQNGASFPRPSKIHSGFTFINVEHEGKWYLIYNDGQIGNSSKVTLSDYTEVPEVDWIFKEHFHKLGIGTPPSVSKKCECSLDSLMAHGCRCGGI